MVVTGTAPALATGVYLTFDSVNANTQTIDLTALLYELAASAGSYFDGNTAGASWDGTANNSTSTLPDTPAPPPVPPAVRGGWETYGSALRFNYDQAEYERTRVPVDCPNDGTPLQAAPSGQLHCPFDGWTWPEKRIL